MHTIMVPSFSLSVLLFLHNSPSCQHSPFHTLCPYAQTHTPSSHSHTNTYLPITHNLTHFSLSNSPPHTPHLTPSHTLPPSHPHTHPSSSHPHTHPSSSHTHLPSHPSSCEERLTSVKCPVLRLACSTTSDWGEQLWSQCTGKLECKTLNLI